MRANLTSALDLFESRARVTQALKDVIHDDDVVRAAGKLQRLQLAVLIMCQKASRTSFSG